MLDVGGEVELPRYPAEGSVRRLAQGRAVPRHPHCQRTEMLFCLLGRQRDRRHTDLPADCFGNAPERHADFGDGMKCLPARAALERQSI